MQIISV